MAGGNPLVEQRLGKSVKFNQKKHEWGAYSSWKVLQTTRIVCQNKLLDVIVDLANHPKCAEFLAYKLCKHFICDHPTQAMIQPIIGLGNSDGHLPTVHKAVLEVVYEHAEHYEVYQPRSLGSANNKYLRTWARANNPWFSQGKAHTKGNRMEEMRHNVRLTWYSQRLACILIKSSNQTDGLIQKLNGFPRN